jgi:hypothetical protein
MNKVEGICLNFPAYRGESGTVPALIKGVGGGQFYFIRYSSNQKIR